MVMERLIKVFVTNMKQLMKATIMVLQQNPDLVGAPVVPDTGWFNQKKGFTTVT